MSGYQCGGCGIAITGNTLCRDCLDRRFERWCRDVRDPAKAATTGLISVTIPDWQASYEIAPIPNGWAWRYEVRNTISGVWETWRPIDTEGEAREAALNGIERHTKQTIARDLFGGAA